MGSPIIAELPERIVKNDDTVFAGLLARRYYWDFAH
jgi:hypothetical protein